MENNKPIYTLPGLCDNNSNATPSYRNIRVNFGLSETDMNNGQRRIEQDAGAGEEAVRPTGRHENKMTVVLDFAKITTLRFRLIRRSRILNDVMVIIGVFGMLLSIVVNQLITSNAFGVDQWNHPGLIAMRCVITFSTIVLLVINVVYQVTIFKLWFIDIPGKPFLVAVRLRWILSALLELIVCAIQPIPWDFNINQERVISEPPYLDTTTINVNVFLSIGMCMRLFLVFRAILQHHRLYSSVIVHIFGPLNRMDIGYDFLFKVIMDTHAGIVVASILTLLTIFGAWMEMHCETATNGPLSNYLNALWFTIVTFTTVSIVLDNIALYNLWFRKCRRNKYFE